MPATAKSGQLQAPAYSRDTEGRILAQNRHGSCKSQVIDRTHSWARASRIQALSGTIVAAEAMAHQVARRNESDHHPDHAP